MNSTLLCTFHACPMSCQAQECQLLAYVKELERDKATLRSALVRCYGRLVVKYTTGLDEGAMDEAESALKSVKTATMQAMKEGK